MTPNWLHGLDRQPARKAALTTAAGTLTYGELAQRAAAARSRFTQRGLQPGQHVLLALSDERQLLCLLLAACGAGLAVMLADPELPAAAVAEILRRYEPDAVVLDQALAERWALPVSPQRLWPIPPEPPAQAGALLRRLLGRARPAAATGLFAELDTLADLPATPAAPVSGDATALIFFTSGSTTVPKAVELGHAALSAHLDTLARHHGYAADSRLLNPLPLHHADGLVQGPLVALQVGATACRPAAFTAQQVPRFLDGIYADAITHLVAVPTMLALMLRLGANQADSFGSAEFRHVVSTAGHLEEGLWRRFEQHFGVRVCNTYGLTETVAGGIFSGPGDDTRRLGTLGRPVDCEVRLIGADGLDVEPGSTGELLVRGANLMRGYYRDPEATAAVLRDGWLHTGDLAWRDDAGFLHFAGRAKSVIVSGGHNIQPEEVNDALGRHPGVQAVATLGLPHPEWEAIVVSAVVPAGGHAPDEADLLAHARLHLPPYKVPRRIVFLGALPYGPSGKVRIEALRELCLAEPAAAGRAGGHADAQADAQRVIERVMALARQVFRAHPGELGAHAGPDNTLGWDSLAHIEFVTALEAQFGITLTERDIVAITHLGAAVDVVARALARG